MIHNASFTTLLIYGLNTTVSCTWKNIDRTGGAWLLMGMALFMISILHVNPHSLSDSNLEWYGQCQLPTAIELTCLRSKFDNF